MTLKVKFWYFLTAPHYSNFQNLVISFEYSWFLAKILSNFVSLPWKLHNRECHNVYYLLTESNNQIEIYKTCTFLAKSNCSWPKNPSKQTKFVKPVLFIKMFCKYLDAYFSNWLSDKLSYEAKSFVQNDNLVLNRLVPCLKCMELACWVFKASLDLYYHLW